MSKPFFSVIINCLNCEAFLEDALISLKKQSFSDWEIILWDNASDKSVRPVLDSVFEEIDHKKIVFRRADLVTRLYDARNQAVNFASGKYIVFLDSDDIWLESYLSNIYLKAVDEDYPDCIVSNYFVSYENCNSVKRRKRNIKTDDFKFAANYQVAISSTAIRRDFFNQMNGFDPSYNIVGDYEFILRARDVSSISIVKDASAIYRWHSNNLSSKKEELHIKELLRFFRSGVIHNNDICAGVYENYLYRWASRKIAKNKLGLKRLFLVLKDLQLFSNKIKLAVRFILN